jgi:hypothetical protein
MVDRTPEIREKITTWLAEEKIRFKEKTEPGTRLLLDLHMNGFSIHLVQRKETLDSIFLAMAIALPDAQAEHFNHLDEGSKQKCITDLISVFAGNSGLAGFELLPNGVYDFRQMTVTTKQIFYDGLTKDRLFSSIADLFRAYAGISMVLGFHTGVMTPIKPAGQHFYG